MAIQEKKIVRESDWMRIYEFADKRGHLFESKFLVDNVHVSPSSVRMKWENFSEAERVEFASAFSAQPPRNSDDQEILHFRTKNLRLIGCEA
jgi:hypothetical protein